ncbi:CDP-paratose 2-epimerase [Aquisphaera giovannonii]|uniref:CDP-paratose 2-epimerase n=1 Tax=Aquisphaera giovannonii TaxID=406548 RepID=A0A5B9W4N1_9BACT|nr:NAD(P)-dependent oxidoreductase [Aquisphaera giovannonii]QEH35174.1 CDP-paratose 2-epimerase [Aquisphaera giovannonii]
MSRAVLVTGGAGFIGSHVAAQLARRGDRVVLFDQRPPAGAAEWLLGPHADRIAFVRGDVSEWPDVLGAVREHAAGAIVHAAAIGDPAAVQHRPLLALRVNVEGSLHCLEAARLLGLGRVVLFSSIGVLPGIREEPVTASHPVICGDEGPGSGFYGASKVAVEAFAYGYRQAFGVDFAVLRPSAVYGLGMQHPIFIKPMVEDAVDGRPTRFATGRDFPRDYTHVEDVAALALLALDAPADALRDRVFYAATGRPLRTAGELAEVVRGLVPGADIEIGPGLSDADRLEVRYRGVLDISNAREQLGYAPRFGRLEDGVRQYVDEYRRYREALAARS